MSELAKTLIQGGISLVIAIVTAVATVWVFISKKIDDKSQKATDAAVEKRISDLRLEISRLIDEKTKGFISELIEGGKKFAVIEKVLTGFVSVETCIRHHSEMSEGLTKLHHCMEMKFTEQTNIFTRLDERLTALETKLAGNGNFDVGKKIDRVLRMLQDSEKENDS